MGVGIKLDKGKQEWYAMPLSILEPLADAFVAGEKKYETFNCLEPFDNPSRRFYNSLMRHLRAAQIDPLAKDEETGCYNLAQVAFSALLRLHNCLELQKKGELLCHTIHQQEDGLKKETGLKLSSWGLKQTVRMYCIKTLRRLESKLI